MTAPDSFPLQTVTVVPAHNELAHLPDCVRALTTAALCLPTPVATIVVLDSCDDGSERLAGEFGPDVHFVSVDAGNVGAARAAGFEYAKSLCGHVESKDTWYATTDADSMVDADWLTRMVNAARDDIDMVLGVVRVPNWRNFSPAVVRRYLRAYRSTGPEHDHVHGANMGFRADAYWHVGGFRALATGEDVELVGRFEAAGLAIHRDRRLSVATSDRREGRAPGGFAQHLRSLSRSVRQRRAGAGT
jgi:glycosyltransferase involved in cell wall biosynthesis